MSIRAKFFALTGILLVLFGAVVGILSMFQRNTAHKLSDIVEHHQPIRRLLADLDVQTDEYELQIYRLYLQPSRVDMQRIVERTGQLAVQIRDNFRRLNEILQDAIAANQNDPFDLQTLSYVAGALPLIERQVEPFITLGIDTRVDILNGLREEA